MMTPPKIGRQHIAVTMIDGTSWDVWTAPIDDDLRANAARKHGWADPKGNPVGYLAFLAWSAGKRAQLHTLTWEAFLPALESLDLLEAGTVPPTPTPVGGDSS